MVQWQKPTHKEDWIMDITIVPGEEKHLEGDWYDSDCDKDCTKKNA